MEEKTITFDLSADKLLDMAEGKLDDGEFLGALRLLHKSLDLYGPGADEYADIAEAYEGMELYERAAHAWFCFLDICAEEERVDAYEGLITCYYNLGNAPMAMHYYGCMMCDKYVTDDMGAEMAEVLRTPALPRFKVSWPPESADYSGDIDAGLKAIKSGKYAEAQQCFLRVHPDSEYYPSAMNYLAVSHLLAGDSAKAEKVCTEALARDPENVQLLSTYAAVLIEQERRQESRAVAEKLAVMETDDPDELYKVATVCCENELYDEAYQKFCLLERDVFYDKTLLFFKAVAAFRSGRVKESLASFGKILDLYPRAAVARYYFRAVREYAEGGGKGDAPFTSFFYRVPRGIREENAGTLVFLTNMTAENLQMLIRQPYVNEVLEWAFDESDGQEPQLQALAAEVLAAGDLQPQLWQMLLDPSVGDVIKIDALRRKCERNKDFSCGVVISDIYCHADFERLELGRRCRQKFISAYAMLFARFAVIGDVRAEDLRFAAQSIYMLLAGADKFSAVKDKESLAGAIYLTVSSSADKRKLRRIVRVLGTTEEEVSELLSAIHACMPAMEEAAAAEAEQKPKRKKRKGEEANDDEAH